MPAFPEISKIKYEGPTSKNPLAFRWYNPEEKIEGRSMKEHLRFAVVYWHTFRGTGSDPFGPGTAVRPWDDGSNSVENAQRRARVAFELIEKLDAGMRRHIIFMDRDEFLDHSARILVDLRINEPSFLTDDDIPF